MLLRSSKRETATFMAKALGASPRRQYKKGVARPKAKAAQKPSQCLTINLKTGALKVCQQTNADGSSGENLNNVLNKALIELNHICLAEPYNILILLQMAKDQANFTQKAKPSEDWLRRSYVYFSSVPKGLWVEVLVEYAATTGDRWDGDLIRKADRKNDLRGIQVLTSFFRELYVAGQDPSRRVLQASFEGRVARQGQESWTSRMYLEGWCHHVHKSSWWHLQVRLCG